MLVGCGNESVACWRFDPMNAAAQAAGFLPSFVCGGLVQARLQHYSLIFPSRQSFTQLHAWPEIAAFPLSAGALMVAVQGFPEGTWPVVLHLVEPHQGDTVNVHQAWTWSVFAVTSAMIGAEAVSKQNQLFC
jgi:hypothetical protein